MVKFSIAEAPAYRRGAHAEARPPRGQILIARLAPQHPDEVGRVREAIVERRAECPWAPLMLHVPSPASREPGSAAAIGVLAEHVGARAVEWGATACATRHARTLCDVSRLEDDLIRWLRLIGVSVSSRLECCIRVLTAPVEKGRWVSSGERLDAAGIAPRTIRRAFIRAGLPGPACWVTAGVLVRAVGALQLGTVKNIQEAAWWHGFSDASSFSRSLVSLTGVRPGDAARLMGWEWLVWSALSRSAWPGLSSNRAT